MASTYSALKIELIGTGEQSGTWGTTTNVNLGTALEQAIVGRATANFTADSDLTITLTDTNATQVARHYILNVTSGVSLTTTRNLIVPTIDKPYIIENNTTGGQSIVVKTSSGTGVTVPNGRKTMVYANAVNVVSAEDYKPSLILGTALPVTSGGTGVTTSTGSGSNVLSVSPALTGVPTAPTATAGTNTTQVATTAFVTTATTGSFVTLTGNQTIAGIKTFSSDIVVNSLDVGRGSGNISTNTAVGSVALISNTTGTVNTAIGANALTSNTTGGGNLGVGVLALQNSTTGSLNVAVGSTALGDSTTGICNVAVGNNALENLTTGGGNIGVGGLTSGATTAPVFNVTTENNRIVMGSTSVTDAYVQVAWTVVSDARDKINFNVVPHGLDFVNKLKPVAYQFRFNRESDEPNGGVRYGFKAQDILELEGDNPVIIDNETPDKLRYRGESLVPVLVKAIQELKAEFDAYKASHP